MKYEAVKQGAGLIQIWQV